VDERDELRGAALAATWPKHLTAEELFEALVPPKRTNFTGEYQRFLWSDFAAQIPTNEIVRALKWAQPQLEKPYVEHGPMGGAALSIVAAGIESFHDAEICDRIADILVQLAKVPNPALQVMRKLAANRQARNKIGRTAIRVAPDAWAVQNLKAYGVFDESDVAFFVDELETTASNEERERLAFLIAILLYGVPWFDFALIERIFVLATADPILAAALEPVVSPVELDSKEALDQKAQFESRTKSKDDPDPTTAIPNLSGPMAAVDRGEATAFLKICDRLPGTSWSPELPDRPWSPEEELLPGWAQLRVAEQSKIILAAEMYLNGCCPTNDSWIDTAAAWYFVFCGYWAFRVLVQMAPKVFDKIALDVWYAWMPSIFGDPYLPGIPDETQTQLLKTAYLRMPTRFCEVLSHFVDAGCKTRAEIFILDRITTVWDDEIAALMLSKLRDDRLNSSVFRQILRPLLEIGDATARQIATDTVECAASGAADELEKPIEAALELLNRDASGAWKVVWPVAEKNMEFAERLLSRFTVDPYSSDTTKLVNGLKESQLAELRVWLSQHKVLGNEADRPSAGSIQTGGFTLIPSRNGWYWLSSVVMDALIQRGTPQAVEAICWIGGAVPDELLRRVEHVARDVVREKTWKPLSPAELIDLVAGPAAASRSRTQQITNIESKPSIRVDQDGDAGEPTRGGRGRKRKFSEQQLEIARQMKAAQKSNNEIAKVLYGTNPTEAQRRSVPTTLKYHFGRETG